MALTIVSYNINGIRAGIRKGLLDWIAAGDYDIICLQETKAHPEQVELAPFTELGYHAYWCSAEKRGYSGLLTLSRQPADHVSTGCGIQDYDCEGRILRTDFGEWTLLNCYFPSGTTGDVRQSFKMQFLDDFYDWIAELRRERPNLIIAGDYNIAHNEIDIHDPVRNKRNSGFLPEERAWMSKWFDNGFIDSFRHLNPEETAYSWWSYRAGARANNKGWRLDYLSVSRELKEYLQKAYHLPDALHSDHCPVCLEIDL